jgi:hypothetical protein
MKLRSVVGIGIMKKAVEFNFFDRINKIYRIELCLNGQVE